MSLNRVLLIGNVGKNPEIHHTENSTKGSFSLATTEKYRDKAGNLVDQTEWHNIVCWGSLAEIVEKYVVKGMKIFVEGSLRYSNWIDQNGVKRYSLDITASTIEFLSTRNDMQEQNSAKNIKTAFIDEERSNNNGENRSLDDLPF